MRIIMFTAALILALVGQGFAQTTSSSQDKPKPPMAGTVTDAYGNRQGQVSQGGVVTDNYGNRKGYVAPNGTITDNYGNRLGTVKK